MSYGKGYPPHHSVRLHHRHHGYERYILDLPEYEAKGFLMPDRW